MAEPAETEVVASSADGIDHRPPPAESSAANDNNADVSIQEEATTAFQAINTQAVTENASTAMSTAAPPPEDAAVTQDPSQTVQTSSGPSDSHKDLSQVDESNGNMAAESGTYGTRSRNRTGNARPNYAEDQDMDFELSSTTTRKKTAGDHATTAAPAQNGAGDAKRAQEFARFIAVNSSGTHANGSTPKESTPGTPGVASNVSKKRKAGGAPATLMSTPPPSNSPQPTMARKLGAPSVTARETNVMTFTKHRSCLNKKGELVADDGTKLCVNGKRTLS